MKKTILIFLLGITTSAISQETQIIEIKNAKEDYNIDGIKIFYEDNNLIESSKNVFYVNGKLLKNQMNFETIDPDIIESVDVKKGVFDVNGYVYQNKISIKTYEKYNDAFITIPELTNEYLNLKDSSKIYQIDDVVIDGKMNDYIIHKKSIQSIRVSKIDSTEELKPFYLIKIVTDKFNTETETTTFVFKKL